MKHLSLTRGKQGAALLLAALCLVVSAACGKGEGSPQEGGSTQTSTASASESAYSGTTPATMQTDGTSAATEDDATASSPTDVDGTQADAPLPGEPTTTTRTSTTKTAAAQSTALPDAAPLVQGVQSIFVGKVFTLKGRMTSSLPGASSGLSEVVLVADKDKSCVEVKLNMADLFASSGATQAHATALELLLGKTCRMLVTKDQELYVFPDRRIYLSMPGLTEVMPSFGGDITKLSREVKTTTETLNGTKYLCGTVSDSDGANWKFFFLNGELKRFEKTARDAGKTQTTIVEVDSLTAVAEQKYLSTSGMIAIDIARIAQVLG